MKNLVRVVCALALLLLSTTVSAQWLNQRSADNEEEVNGLERYYEWFFHQRTFGLGSIPEGAYKRAVDQRAALANTARSHNNTLAVTQWTNIGPYNINSGIGGPHGGRINTMVVNPVNSQIAYMGAANGGVWKTTNGGGSWRPVSNGLSSLAMGALAIDPKNPNTIYAGTGEFAQGFGSFFGGGIYRSTNAGASWVPIGLSNVGAFSKIVVHPVQSNVIYAAGAGSGSGLYVTKDGGGTWTRMSGSFPPGAVTDMDFVAGENNDVIYVAIPSHGIYRSDDGGALWYQVHQYTEMRRMHIAANPLNSNDIVDLSINYNGGFEGMSRSTNGGSTWDDISGAFRSSDPFAVAGGYQGWYDAYVVRDPKNAEHFLLGAISVWATDDGGGSWNDVAHSYQAGGTHPDQHAAAFASKSDTMFVTGDGGVARSIDRGNTFEVSDDSTAITQAYSLAIDQTVDDASYIGTQDNGILGGSSVDNWDVLGGGDGGNIIVDSKDHTTLYFNRPTAFNVSQWDPTSGEQDFSNGITTSDSVGWLKPIAQDETNHILYTGSQYLYILANNSSTWTRRNKKLATGAGAYINAIGPVGDGKSVMIGTTDGHVWTTPDNGLTFKASSGLPGRSVTAFAVSPASKTTFYVTLSGFGAGHIFKTTDFGVTWANVSGQMPDISCNAIVIDPTHPSHLYVGTDVGVFYSPDDGINWVPYGTGLPNVAIFAMSAHKSRKLLRVGTHGRSVWEAPMEDVPSGVTTPTISSLWFIGEPTDISWYGVPSGAKVEISTDNAQSWQTISDAATGNALHINAVNYPASQQALVRVTSGTEVLLSRQFKITSRVSGSTLSVFSEQALYMYDLAYDGDDGTLFITNFNDADNKIYKMDPTTGALTGNIAVSGGKDFTGICYDGLTKHLFVHQALQTTPGSNIFEITTTGTIVHKWASPSTYGTGVLVIGDTLFLADRNNNVIHRVHKTNPSISYDDFELARTAAFGPRCLTLNTFNGELLHTWTDFQGNSTNASLYDSYILKLSRNDGTELSSWFVQEGGNNGTNVRGIEYDPRSNGTQVWVTVLNSGNSSKVMKITLVDGPTNGVTTTSTHSNPTTMISVYPNPVTDHTTVNYSLENTSDIRIVVRDILGREVFSNAYGVETGGDHAHRIQLGRLTAGGYTVGVYAGQSLVGVASLVVY